MRIPALIATLLLVSTCAFGQQPSNAHQPSNGLIFGNGALYTGATKPTNSQAVCNNNGVLGGCTGGGGVTSVTATSPIVSTGGTAPVLSCPTCSTGNSLTDAVLPTPGTATVAQAVSSSSLTINKPSSVVSGHTMIMGYGIQTSTVPTPPSGWALIRADALCAGSGNYNGSFYKVAGNSEPSNYTWTVASGTYGAGGIVDVGVTSGNPVDVIAPPICVSTGAAFPTINPTNNAEQVVVFDSTDGGTGSAALLGATLRANQPQLGTNALALGTFVANYPTSQTITTSWYGAAPSTNLSGQEIAIAPASTYSARAVLQGDSYAEITRLDGTAGSDDSINKFNIDGRFNVKNPIYGAKGDGLTDDTAAIQATEVAACAYATANSRGATVWFPAGTYITSFPLISNCGKPIAWKGESQQAPAIQGVGSSTFPTMVHEGTNLVSNLTNIAPLTTTSLATGTGFALNWGATSQYFYDLKDVIDGLGGFNSAEPLNGLSAMSVEGYFDYTGGAVPSDSVYLMGSTGDDLNLGGGVSRAITIYLVTGYYPEACITTSGSGRVCTSNNSHAISPNTIYEFQASYDGSDLRLFYGIPGNTTTLAGTAAATGTVVQNPGEVWALGDGSSGITIGGGNSITDAHWVGQLDSIRVSNTARNTSTYTAPTAKFSSDGNTELLMNNPAQTDSLLQITHVSGGFNPVWIPFHSNLMGTGNNNGSFTNLTFSGGSYGLFVQSALYTNIDHISATGARYGLAVTGLSYGTHVNHLAANPGAAGEAGVLFNGAGITQFDWLNTTGGYYGMELENAGGVFSQLYFNPASLTVADMDIGGNNPFSSISIHELTVDFEGGGVAVPAKIWGQNAVEFYGGTWQYDPSVNAIWAAPSNASAGLGITLNGGQVTIEGSPINPLVSWKGTGTPATPLIWNNPLVDTQSLVGSGVPLCDVVANCVVKPDLPIPMAGATPTMTVLSGGDTDAETDTETLGANTTLTLFASGATAPVNGKVFHLVLTQPSGGHSYTAALSAGSGVNLVYPIAGACASLPSMPTGTGHSLMLDLIYNALPSTPEIDVLACPVTGS